MKSIKTKHYLLGALLVVLVIAFAQSQGILFDDGLSYVEINHGNHKHYFPKERDSGLDIHSFPTEPPAKDEIISRQGQLLKMIKDEKNVFYVPKDRNQNAPLSNFPIRPPAAFERITPNGEMINVANP